MSDVLQKLLMPWLSQAIGDISHPYVGGPVTRLVDVRHIGTANDLVDAYGLRSSAAFVDQVPFVDVVRFEVEPMMRLRTPTPVERPWPTYPMGFLHGPDGGEVPVWVLERTRYPRGAELWRVHHSGEQEMISVFDGIARGWRDARGYTPPVQLVGPRAEIDGVEYPAELTDPSATHVELVHVGEDLPAGFELVRPLVSARTVPVQQCSLVHDVDLRADWLGAQARVLQPGREGALLLLDQPTLEQVERTRAQEVEPGYYEVLAPESELGDRHGTSTELPRS